jgi:hypothetical protein
MDGMEIFRFQIFLGKIEGGTHKSCFSSSLEGCVLCFTLGGTFLLACFPSLFATTFSSPQMCKTSSVVSYC